MESQETNSTGSDVVQAEVVSEPTTATEEAAPADLAINASEHVEQTDGLV